jgi:hypothetical protein
MLGDYLWHYPNGGNQNQSVICDGRTRSLPHRIYQNVRSVAKPYFLTMPAPIAVIIRAAKLSKPKKTDLLFQRNIFQP